MFAPERARGRTAAVRPGVRQSQGIPVSSRYASV